MIDERARAEQQMREVLFDSRAVLMALDEKAKTRTSAANVCDVLDAVVRLMRKDALRAIGDQPNDTAHELAEALRDVLGWVPGRAVWHTDEPMKAAGRARAALARYDEGKT